MLQFMIRFLLLGCIFLLIKLKVLKRIPSEAPAGAIVMACGIFINGAMKNIPFLEQRASELFATSLLLIWIFIAASYINSFIKGRGKESHLKGPIPSFAVGTWVAGTSVCGIAVFQRLPDIAFFSRFLFWVNMVLWIFYMSICIRNYGVIFGQRLYNKVHGILLIATVSTQSTVILGNTVFAKAYPAPVSRVFIYIGIVLYIMAFTLIIRRYFFSREWSIEEDWANTNCIIHGAMSITGLASVVSGAINHNFIIGIWIWVIIWFVIVEAIELLRGYKRIKKYGFIDGVVNYHVTQWSRIFTFGMFYTFTMRLNLKGLTSAYSLLSAIQDVILRYGTWVMVIILLYEGSLFFMYQSVDPLGKQT